MILGQATFAALEAPDSSDARERGTDSTKNMKRAVGKSQDRHLMQNSALTCLRVRVGT